MLLQVVFYQSCLRERQRVSKKSTTFEKKMLTNAERCGNISNVPRLGRVPCKLNNERNEKHQTGAQKCATNKLARSTGFSQLPGKA